MLFKDADYFRIPDMIASITLEEANAVLTDHYGRSGRAVSVVLPASTPEPVAA